MVRAISYHHLFTWIIEYLVDKILGISLLQLWVAVQKFVDIIWNSMKLFLSAV